MGSSTAVAVALGLFAFTPANASVAADGSAGSDGDAGAFVDVLGSGGAVQMATPWCRQSFGSGTTVLMADGSSAAIGSLVVGDEVRTADPETGAVSSGQVEATYVHRDELLNLTTTGGSVVTTRKHPFWDASAGEWALPGDIPTGNALLDANGHAGARVLSVEASGQEGAAYNLSVSGSHSYFVSVGDQFALVHNCGSPSQSPIWMGFRNWRPTIKTNAETGSKKRFYQWDYTHGEIEMYNRSGIHLGVLDPITGKMIKPAVKGRKIDLS